MFAVCGCLTGIFPDRELVMGSHQRGRITLYCVADSFDRKKLDEVGVAAGVVGVGDVLCTTPNPPALPAPCPLGKGSEARLGAALLRTRD